VVLGKKLLSTPPTRLTERPREKGPKGYNAAQERVEGVGLACPHAITTILGCAYPFGQTHVAADPSTPTNANIYSPWVSPEPPDPCPLPLSSGPADLEQYCDVVFVHSGGAGAPILCQSRG
jgi:hypothetical protein